MKQPSRRDCTPLALAFILCWLSISAIAAPQAEVGYVDATLCSECHAKMAVVRLYNRRGTAEQWIKEGKQASALDLVVVIYSGPTRSACSRAYWPTTWGICGGGWCCRGGSTTGC